MSDLSLPAMTLLPIEAAAKPGARDPQPFAWPTPAYACYPAPAALDTPEPCEIEGINGRVTRGLLVTMDLAAEVVQLQVSRARTITPLRFAQFRRLTLTRPLQRLLDDAALNDAMAHPTTTHIRLKIDGAPDLEFDSLGHHEHDHGIFLFAPIDAQGSLQRSFVPRSAYASVDIGERIGALLVQAQAASPEHVELALEEQRLLRNKKVGEILLIRQVVNVEELEQAISEQARMPMVRIGEALIALGFIDAEQLSDALSQQREDRGVPLGELLVRRGLVTRTELQAALARKMGYPLVDIEVFQPETEALARLPYAVACRLLALPLMQRGGRLVVAMEDPSRPDTIDDVEFAAQGKVVPVLAHARLLAPAIHKSYERIGAHVDVNPPSPDPGAALESDANDTDKLLASLEQQHHVESVERANRQEDAIEQSDNSLVRLINSMIAEAHAQGVSDIHIECQPGREKLRIRFRKDGILRPYMQLPHTYRSAMIARLKIMCDLDISERRKPQDGKIAFGKFVAGQRLELRVATIPTANGLEDAVLRLLASARAMPIDQLGLSPRNLQCVKQAAERPYGMLLCVGPTGSGKTTTLHSILSHINRPERKIWTAEDPVEITQTGMRQVQINPKIDWTFAKALRAFLRADPDVIMVGEIRDQETAQVAIEASLTGHLVMSTLHTNSAAETVTRLLDMGMDPFNFADSLLGVLAQRLVRSLCRNCRQVREATAPEVDELLADSLHAGGATDSQATADATLADWLSRFGQGGKLMHHHSPGCSRCDNSGFRGRAAVHELLLISAPLRQLIQTGSRSDQLLHAARAEGLRTLRQDGIEKVWAGITTIEEVRACSNT